MKAPKNLKESHILVGVRLLPFWKTAACWPLSPAKHGTPDDQEPQLTMINLDFSDLPSIKTGYKHNTPQSRRS